MSAAEKIRARVFYEGRVQGVGFRMSARHVAKGYEVSGWVRNLDDGRVEMLAEGEKLEVEAFLEGIGESHLRTFIRRREVDWQPFQGNLRGFEISG